MTQTASLMEVLTVAFNIVGLLVAGRMFMLTKQRYDAVLLSGGTQAGPRGLAAWRHIRCETGRILYHLISFGLGLWLMSLVDGGSAYAQASAWGRLFLAVMFTVFSVMDLMSDSRLASMLSARAPGARGPA